MFAFSRVFSFPVDLFFADGTVSGVVILPGEGKNTFRTLMETPQDVRVFFGKHYPSAFGPEGPSEEIAKEFFERR